MLAQEAIGSLPVRRGPPAGLHRLPSGGHLVKHRHFQIPVERERKRAGDRRGGHHQQVGVGLLLQQRGALQHAEPMLFVHDRKTQPGEDDVLLQERVSARHQMDAARGET